MAKARPSKCGMLHRRERRAVDNDGGDAGGGQAAGERAADRAGTDDTDLGRKAIAHAAESGAVATVAASVRMVLLLSEGSGI